MKEGCPWDSAECMLPRCLCAADEAGVVQRRTSPSAKGSHSLQKCRKVIHLYKSHGEISSFFFFFFFFFWKNLLE